MRTTGKNPFGPFAHPVSAVAATSAWIALLLAFRSQPQWDLAAAAAFFDSAACAASPVASGQYCAGFTFSGLPFLATVRQLLHPLPALLGIGLMIVLAVELRAGLRWHNPGIRLKVVLIGALILGPGLIVNGILKAYWGRPRPWMTEDFGGWLPFVEAGTETDLCASNCSFVSGEAAAAGWLMCLALLLAIRRRFLAAAILGGGAIAMALLRVAFGAHYLSDALLGFFMTVVLFMMLAALSEWLAARRS
ncbi:phosphatase PAP2 family protein [Oricola cellulosilytica]|uniref:phosphatase PAP2 family protein n=1 Tax=Oricola cellulosilytica TaxID=1429082 RepID=UPI001304BED8|nr:phosphatase PAP2 family protein [Oricola cellulosilytica]